MIILLVGFRWSPGLTWDISIDQPVVWVELDEKLYAPDGFGDKVDDLHGALENLKDIAPEDQRSEIWRHILSEFASVKTTFFRLRLKPGQIEEIDAEHEDVYDAEYAKTRTIKIVVDGSRGVSSGYASPVWKDSRLTGCNIVIAPRTLIDPTFYTHVLIHELFHCVGLDHQQDDSDSVMSYSNNSTSISSEERMGLTYQYPLKPGYAKESATFGLSCTPRK